MLFNSNFNFKYEKSPDSYKGICFYRTLQIFTGKDKGLPDRLHHRSRTDDLHSSADFRGDTPISDRCPSSLGPRCLCAFTQPRHSERGLQEPASMQRGHFDTNLNELDLGIPLLPIRILPNFRVPSYLNSSVT